MKEPAWENLSDKPKERAHIPDLFWRSADERLRYHYAIDANPRRAGEALSDWLERISAAAAGLEREPGGEG